MSSNSITSGTSISTLIRGIPPNNDLPLHGSDLLKLTTYEMLHAVLSNLFVVPEVSVNTMVWKYWDIFNDTDYTWKVVRSRPECVKLFSNDFRGFLCEPVPNSRGKKYRALQLTDTLRATQLRTNVSLEDALSICEHEASKFRRKKSFTGDLFSNKRSALKYDYSVSTKRDPWEPYQAEFDCFEGLEWYIEEIEQLTKAMTGKNKYWVHRSTLIDFEKYLIEQQYCDSPICDHCQIKDEKEREESLSFPA